APLESRRRTVSSLPVVAAHSNGVAPNGPPWMLTYAPRSRSGLSDAGSPNVAAASTGVRNGPSWASWENAFGLAPRASRSGASAAFEQQPDFLPVVNRSQQRRIALPAPGVGVGAAIEQQLQQLGIGVDGCNHQGCFTVLVGRGQVRALAQQALHPRTVTVTDR